MHMFTLCTSSFRVCSLCAPITYTYVRLILVSQCSTPRAVKDLSDSIQNYNNVVYIISYLADISMNHLFSQVKQFA